MIIWLASYPRSGNTLTRTLLFQTFGVNTWSHYNDRTDLGASPQAAASIGHQSYKGEWDRIQQELTASPELHFVKTHHPPPNDDPAIYITRDGRSASVSYFHYRAKQVRQPVSLRRIVQGDVTFGSWSDHLDAWRPLGRKRTLFLRYEEINSQPERVIGLIARFIGRQPVAPWRNPFAEQQKIMPTFFHRGSDADNLREFGPQDLELFWERHGKWMRILGYGTRFDPEPAPELNRWRPRSHIVDPM